MNIYPGSTPWNSCLEKVDGQALVKQADYAKLEEFEALARRQQPVANVFSILTLLRQLHRAESGGEGTVLPDNDDQLQYELDLLSMAGDRQMQSRFLTPGGRQPGSVSGFTISAVVLQSW